MLAAMTGSMNRLPMEENMRTRRPRLGSLLILLCLTAIATTGAGAADTVSLEGHWAGVVKLPGQDLEVDVDFVAGDDGWSGDITIAHLTPRDMVTHRSGLPRHDLTWYNNDSITRAELVHRLRYLEPNKELRESWQYNNLMFLTSGYLIEQLTGGTWEQAICERIFSSLGMTRTTLSVADSQQDDDHARPYIEDDDEIRQVDFRPINVMGPAGSINSSVDEMARWLRVHLSDGQFDGKRIIADARGRVSQLSVPLEPQVDAIAFSRLPDRRLSEPAFLARLAGDYTIPNQPVTLPCRAPCWCCRPLGGPRYRLVPSGINEFIIEGLNGFSVTFTIDEKGPATEAVFIQPNGVFVAKRTAAGDEN